MFIRDRGWITLILGILELLASLSLFGGGAYGRWFGIFVGALAAIAALLSIPAYPLWSIAVFALSLWIIHGLVVYSGPEQTPGSGPTAGAGPPTAAV
jgi:type IV secretory pathway TrbD component